MPKSVTRIISDLHYRDPASWLQDLDQLVPIFDGAEHVVVNGDALDTQVIPEPEAALSELHAFAARYAPRTTFITGNHDPEISQVHELSLCADQVWLTHGDVLFNEIAPWSGLAPEIRRRLRHHSAHLSREEFARLETRFPIFRRVCKGLPNDAPAIKHGPLAYMFRLFQTFFPPHRPLLMMKAWKEFPRLAANLAHQQRPSARFIIMGHTHHAGLWKRSGRVVINTGSFAPPKGGQLVEIRDDTLAVHEIKKRGDQFHVGERLVSFKLDPRAHPAASVLQQ